MIKRFQTSLGVVLSTMAVLVFVFLAEFDPVLIRKFGVEDGPVETLSAIFFGLASLGFCIAAYRSEYLRGGKWPKYLMIASWALLMFVFMGEEISWGQRILGIATPEALREVNLQDETNIHNIEVLNTFLGGKYRYLSIMMLTTGLLLPVFVLFEFGRKTIQRFAFPVAPLYLAPLFVGAYAFGQYYYPSFSNDATEVREFLMSVGMVAFASIGALSPCVLFRVCGSDQR